MQRHLGDKIVDWHERWGDMRWASPLIAILCCAMAIAWGAAVLENRLVLEVQGQVVESRSDCDPQRREACTTLYTIRGPDGRLTRYDSRRSGTLISEELHPGDRVEKRRWHIDVRVNDRTVSDFWPFASLAVLVQIAAAAAMTWCVRRLRRSSE